MSAAVCRLLAAASIVMFAGTALADRDGGRGGRDRDQRGGGGRDSGWSQRNGDQGRSERGGSNRGGFDRGRSDRGFGGNRHDRDSGFRFSLNIGTPLFYDRRPIYRYSEPAPRYCPPPVIIDPCPPRPVCPPPVVVVDRCPPPVVCLPPPRAQPVVVVERPCEPRRVIVEERCEPRTIVVDRRPDLYDDRRCDPPRYEARRVPSYVIVREAARDYGNLCSDLTIGGRRVKAVVSVRTVNDRLCATARFVGDGCDLPDLDAVSIKIKGDGDIWSGALQSVNPGRDRCDYAIDGIRWRGGDSLQVELQVNDRDARQVVRWE